MRTFLKLFFITGLVSVCSFLMAATPDAPRLIHAWQLDAFYTEKQEVEVDTTVTSFQIHNPVFQRSISSSYLGNAGLAAKSDIFDDRGPYSDFIFINHFQVYLHQPRDIKYYNTRRPFSLIDFSTGGPRRQNEKMLGILHTQNVNPDFNLGFRYFNINSDGQYQNQRAVTNAVSLFSSYEADSYQLHANLNLNSARVSENGGLADDFSLYRPGMDPLDHQVRLQNVQNSLDNTSLFISHSWKPFFYSSNDTLEVENPSWFGDFQLFHVFHYDQYRRLYVDPFPGSGFYPDILINQSSTFDSVYYRSLTNSLMMKLPAFTRGIVSFDAIGGIKNELLSGSYNIYNDTTFHFNGADTTGFSVRERDEIRNGSNALIATAKGSIGDVFAIWGEGSLFFQGYRQGEYDMKAGIRFDFFEGKNRSVIEGDIRQTESKPSIFLNSFASNHFEWQNDFRLIGRSTVRGLIFMPERNFGAGVSFHLLNNYIYFDQTANPRQHTDIFPVMEVSLNKDFNLWRFNFRNVLKYQVSGNQGILPLPDLSIYQSTWFQQSLIRGLLTLQIGFDVYYTTEFAGYAYQPATSQFYLQNERLLGNYPYVDLFISFKHKRMRGFFKAEHVNSGQINPEYFTVLHYPRNQRTLKFGFSWSFYN
jgi:hypothetical protein